MAKERPVNLENLRPGALIVQPAKRVCETRMTETKVTIVYEDGSEYTGDYSEAVFILVPAKDELPSDAVIVFTEPAPEPAPADATAV